MKRVERIKKSCEVCHEDYLVLPYRATSRFCGLKCVGVWNSQNNLKGKPHPNAGKKRASSVSRSETFKKKWQDPKFQEQMSLARKKQWTDGKMDDRKPAVHRRQSRQELSLIPIMESWGFRHNTSFFIKGESRTRLPDFVDVKNKRVLEYFGDFWHPKEHDAEYIEWYRNAGWDCQVLRESELTTFMAGVV